MTAAIPLAAASLSPGWRARLYGALALIVVMQCFGIARASGDLGQLLRDADAVRSTDPKLFISKLEKAERAVQGASSDQLLHLRLLQAYGQGYAGRYDQAITTAAALFDDAPESAVKLRAGVLVANSTAATRDFALGLRYLERTLDLASRTNEAELRHQAFAVAAMLYNRVGRYDIGRSYAEKLLSDNPQDRNRCLAQQLRVEALFGLGNGIGGEEGVSAAIADCDSLGEAIASNLLRDYLARSWLERGRVADATELLTSHLPEVEATRYPWLISEVHSVLAKLFLTSGDLDAAARHAQVALEFSGNNAFSLPRVDAYKVLYEIAMKRDDLATALDHHRSYAEADKAYLDDVNARELAYLQSRNEVQQKDQEIALLSKQNEVLQLKQQVASQSAQNSRLMLILLAVVLASLGYWAYRVKRVQMAFRRLAHTDALTGISNRGHFRQQVEACLVQCQQRGEEVGMVVFDLDNFKNVNDRYGHAGGDWVLQQIARACRGRCRKGDHFGRLGGEEFAIVLPGCDLVATERIAEACRESLAAIDTRELGDRFTVTSSFGCTSTAVSGHSYEKLLAHADQAMYCAKRGGRDRVRLYVEGEGSPDATPRAAEAELA